MIKPEDLVACLSRNGMDFYVGVPDSLLKDFCAYVDDHVSGKNHIITANEGNAVAMACGYHMATGKYAVVYMQNSGLGNTVNPLTSLVDKEVYRIPMLLVIGWRGEPGVKDEPQHVKQGRITPQQLELLEVPYLIVDAESGADEVAEWASNALARENSAVALLVRKGTFSPYKGQRKALALSPMKREEALSLLLDLAADSAIVSTTGKTSREVFELRRAKSQPQRDFLTVGGMGHTASVALGVALGMPSRRVVCLDGDGSVLMHMGALPVIGNLAPANFVHVLLNNSAHESVGGQPTVAFDTDFKAIALASGYKDYRLARNPEEIEKAWEELSSSKGPVMLEVRISVGSREDLGRPTSSPEENKRAFMEWLQESQ